MPETRRFRVHARHLERHQARVVSEASFEAAAVAYAEDLHSSSDEAAVSLIVRDLASGGALLHRRSDERRDRRVRLRRTNQAPGR